MTEREFVEQEIAETYQRHAKTKTILLKQIDKMGLDDPYVAALLQNVGLMEYRLEKSIKMLERYL